MSDTPEPRDFECGCKLRPKIVAGVKTLELHACPKGLACRIVHMLTEEAQNQGKVVDTRYG